MKDNINKKFFISILFINLFLSKEAFAYIDPGMGSMFLQSIIAVLAVCFSSVMIFWSKIKITFSNIFKKIQKKLSK